MDFSFTLFLFQIVCIFSAFELKECHFPDLSILNCSYLFSRNIKTRKATDFLTGVVGIPRVINIVATYVLSMSPSSCFFLL